MSSHASGHAEAVEVVFDPTKVSYERLVAYFWHTIDPTVKDRQFCDRGLPYRTAIFAHDSQQLKVAQAFARSAGEKQAVQRTRGHRDRAGNDFLSGWRTTTRTTT